MRFFVIVAVLFCLKASAQHQSRQKFNQDWKFRLDSVADFSSSSYDDRQWRRLDLPHDWSIEASFDPASPAGTGGGALPGGTGWYRKSFTLSTSQKNKKAYIQFDGVYRNSEVFINGHSLGKRPYGYSSFIYELTPFLHYGAEKNWLVVKVDNSQQPNSRWYSGSGIYRNAWLLLLEPDHIQPWGSFITTPTVSSQQARLDISIGLEQQQGKNYLLVTTIYDASNKSLGSVKLASKNGLNLQSFTVDRPHLWSVEKPYLYRAITQLKEGNRVVDSYETAFGIRSFYFDREKGFFLNGKPLKILGVCNHHDLGALGAAINTRALERQLQLLKDMGCNGIRTSHNPPAPELLDLADKMGFIVMDEAFDMWAKAKTNFDYHLDWEEWHRRDLEDFIRRDRNHPSVCIWSIGNEIYEQWGDESKADTSGRVIARELVSIVKNLDTTRPITTANNEVNSWNQLMKSGAFELMGYNYSHRRWKDFLKEWPGKKMIVTESTSALETRGYYNLYPADSIRRWPEVWDKPFTGGNADLTISAYDHVSTPWGSTHEESILELKKWDHVSGMYIWTGFDYLGEPTPYPWPARSSYFGIIDLAGFPKDVYYLYQSEFTNKAMLHLLPHWNWKAGDTVDVVAYYNLADEVELFLNGHSFGKRSKTSGRLHVSWRVPYAPGVLKAVSYKNGNMVMQTETRTAQAPYRLRLKADRTSILASGEDLCFVTVEVVDRSGTIVPTAANLVHFRVSGAGSIAGLDNGNPVSLESFRGDRHSAMNGKALCILRSSKTKGRIILVAEADGLLPSTINIETK